jgi:hypothetical protein
MNRASRTIFGDKATSGFFHFTNAEGDGLTELKKYRPHCFPAICSAASIR